MQFGYFFELEVHLTTKKTPSPKSPKEKTDEDKVLRSSREKIERELQVMSTQPSHPSSSNDLDSSIGTARIEVVSVPVKPRNKFSTTPVKRVEMKKSKESDSVDKALKVKSSLDCMKLEKPAPTTCEMKAA
ncbi:TPX2 domain-containing protein [Caenorhabditis elegans]|uniref:TPX2 domain-containing protein n=1 Tax=Caenorhabditis elegans TaxID=6239 RepID=Q21421_CAEEL|nr:TPX2 domain-containing protein [Caenorhabditis elegans]CAA98510.2 TPX2 domain-containing protein [Caenorhabditis elegans]|eukprot:NP_001256308.1 Uncharacterized protein CELE_K10D6.3 [Caenorhabditis elegans]